MSKITVYAIVFSLLFGLVAAQIAKWKGRKPLAWFCLGAVFSLLGLATVLTLKRLPSSERRN